jgi:sugar phosphate isomerase/epimerase
MKGPYYAPQWHHRHRHFSPQARRRFERLADELDMIEALGVETIELPTYDMDIIVGGRQWLSRAGDLARQHGLYLCVETLFGGYVGMTHAASPSRLATELSLISHPHVVATLDFSHSYLQPFLSEARFRGLGRQSLGRPHGRM